MPEKASGEMTPELTEVKYYYLPIMKLVVKYVDIKTGEEISEVINNEETPSRIEEEKEYGDTYKAKEKEFDNYIRVTNKTFYKMYFANHPDELEESGAGSVDEYLQINDINPKEIYIPDNAEGKIEVTVNSDGTYDRNIEVTYYYTVARKVTVKYIDKTTGKELTKEIVKGLDGEEYDLTSETKDIEGYTLVQVPDNLKGIYQDDNTIICYYYAKNTQVSVKYVDKDTGKVIEEDQIDGYVGKEYNSIKKTYNDYEYVSTLGNASGSMGEEGEEVIYYYRKKQEEKPNTNRNTTTNNNTATNNNVIINNYTNIINNTYVYTEPNKSNESKTQIINVPSSGSSKQVIVESSGSVSTEEDNSQSENTLKGNSQSETSAKESVPNSGDNTPVLAYRTIIVVVIANIVLYVMTKKRKTIIK